MNNSIADWTQEGRLWVWRYDRPRHGWRGWHLSADPAGCRSIGLLLNRMEGGGPCHRTVTLSPVTEAQLQGIGYAGRCGTAFERMRIEFLPDAPAATLEAEAARLVLTIGTRHLRELVDAFLSVAAGDGDFGVRFSDDKAAAPWMFWWPPRAADPAQQTKKS